MEGTKCCLLNKDQSPKTSSFKEVEIATQKMSHFLSMLVIFLILIQHAHGQFKNLSRRRQICRLPQDPGSCRKSIPRYFYNSFTKSCDIFIYSGCRGNYNNFDNYGKCLAMCEGV
ncbi:tissue factor pathway inhibitor 2-like [Haliotis rufescens]|uniref:tissue factor pathway inhibitor 2-like n=1 Tax=Haliotis rufescens TaxID=6454 RepID=UPI00201EF46E|nr:tissue factor pathway inhibitor 2-like [Haliotis rufescens]